ncbi:MAG: tRNA (adenosine(37)-N6)-dimethylallyltransferase MiaA [Thermotogota bacterium]|nr:tRNA (adenosine(37)-N6)-dimethylallyltransferase MiaA [Thermotogota bacterium]
MNRIPILYAPTAAGKTSLLLRLTERLPLEVCSMDSMQIYKEMDIGTAKPSEQEQRVCPHHLINLIKPDESFDVNQYRSIALDKIETLEQAEKTYVFAGGTGLYMDVLRYGIFQGVPKDLDLRNRLIAEEENNPGSLRKKLAHIDPQSAQKIHPNDTKRTIRALEVYELSGKTFSELGKQRIPDERFRLIFLLPDREKLYQNINFRVEEMIKKGLIEETQQLLKKYPVNSQSMKAIGYRETIDFLNGQFESKDDYIDTLKKNTRHFAKRQIIWSRRYKEAIRIDMVGKTKTDMVFALEKMFTSCISS